MRIRTLLSAGLLGVAALITLSPAAYAQEGGASEEQVTEEAELLAEENGGTHEDAECVALLIEGKSVDDCQEAPSPILPPGNELVWGSISFAILFVLLRQFAWPGIKKGMEDRSERVRSDLAGAESAKEDAERVLSEYRAQLTDARAEAGRIIEEARQQADAVRRDQEGRVQHEIAAMRERAAADVEAAKAQALADLRNDVASLAIGAAEVIVQRSLDRDTQAQLVDQYIESLGSRAN